MLGSPNDPAAETETLSSTRTFGLEKQYRFSLSPKESGVREAFAWKHSGTKGLELVRVSTEQVLAVYKIVAGPFERGRMQFYGETTTLSEGFKALAAISLVVIVERMRKLDEDATP